jgi:hypothetical protein
MRHLLFALKFTLRTVSHIVETEEVEICHPHVKVYFF